MGLWTALFGKKENADDAADEYIDITPSSDGAQQAAPPVQREGWLSRWRPQAKRDRQIAWLQAGYSEMLTLMRGINDHLQRQEDVQHKLVDVLVRLPDSMDNLKSVGKAADQQVEVLALLRQQLDSSTRHDQQLVDSMNKFNETLGIMDETSRNSGRTVTQLMEKSRDSEKLLHDVIDRSERRFAMLTALFLAAVAVVGLLLFATVEIGPESSPARGSTRVGHPAIDAQLQASVPPPSAAVRAETQPPEKAEPRRSFFGRVFGRKSADESAE